MTVNFLDEKEQIALKLEDMYNKFGFLKYKMNKFEQYSFYMENESFLDDNRVITFYDQNGKLLALKPDITMSIVKNCLKSTQKNHKIYYNESVFRVRKGDDEFKEIHQIGVEFLGSINTYQTLEILNLAKRSLSQISPDFMICISNMGIILKLFEKLSLKNEQKNCILAYLKQKNVHDLQKYLLNEGIFDDDAFSKLLQINSDVKKGILQLREIFTDNDFDIFITEIENISKYLDEIINSSQISLDFSHISSTEYYNGLIFTGYISGLAIPALTGGRYDNLVSKMGLLDKSALGFAVDLSAVEKILNQTFTDTKIVNFDENSDILELIKTSNKLFEQNETFCITD